VTGPQGKATASRGKLPLPVTHVLLTLMSVIASGLTLYGSLSRIVKSPPCPFLATHDRRPVRAGARLDSDGADRVVK
jgi:hypothetical protein